MSEWKRADRIEDALSPPVGAAPERLKEAMRAGLTRPTRRLAARAP